MILVNERTPSAQHYPPCGLGLDQLLILRAKAGEEAAYAELYQRHSQRVAKAIFRITRNVEDTEDAIQDTFTRAFLHLDSFDGRAQFSTWLTRIAINSALMMLRKRSRKAEVSIDANYEDDTTPVFQLEDPRPDPEEIYLHNEEIFRLKTAVHGLPPLLREVTTLRCAEDPSLSEIAEATGISIAAAKSRLLRAGLQLQMRLGSSRRPRIASRRQAQAV